MFYTMYLSSKSNNHIYHIRMVMQIGLHVGLHKYGLAKQKQ